MVARTKGYTYGASGWDLSIVQGPFSVAPCQTLTLRFATFASLNRRRSSRRWSSSPCRSPRPGCRRRWQVTIQPVLFLFDTSQGEISPLPVPPTGDLGYRGVRDAVEGLGSRFSHCISGRCHPPQVGGGSVLLSILKVCEIQSNVAYRFC
jgi:hypothetical protein